MVKVLAQYQFDIDRLIEERNISYLAVFGSHARGDDRPDSDMDFLVEFDKPVGLFHVAGTQLKLQEILGRSVDLVTRAGLNKLIKPYIQDDLQVIYEKRSLGCFLSIY